MPIIQLQTLVNAPIEVVFDLSRSIDLHIISTEQTKERAITGKTSGLIELNEQVTWRAKHLGFYQNLTSKITEFQKPHFFVDEMVAGAFKRFRHEHIFAIQQNMTLMTDIFDYTSPLGFLGKIADKVFLTNYMTQLLERRNRIIRDYAESGKWKQIPFVASKTT